MKNYDELTKIELERGSRVLRTAEQIFSENYHDSEGEDIITSLLRNDLKYDYKNYSDYLIYPKDIKYCDIALTIFHKENFESIRAENNGEFEKDGIKYALIEQAYPETDFELRTGNKIFFAKAIDEKGNLYKVFWAIINDTCEDFSECCDWGNPYFVELIEKVIY